jgi:hypothetical protein
MITWILGAPDPEMAAIEKLLRECGQTVVYATHGAARVTPASATRADSVDVDGDIIKVECRVAGRDGQKLVAAIDHHAPGDAGYGRPPAEFLSASSLGQVIAVLTALDVLPWETIPRHLLLTAAADHCLGPAYRGQCPGVNPDELAVWRAESRAAFQRRPVADVMADVERTTVALRTALTCDPVFLAPLGPDCGDPQCSCHLDGVPRVADMRRETPWPELPEAATRAGISYLSGPLVGRDGRRQYTVSGTHEQVKAWLEHWAPANGIVDTYGDPARGFAGGYAQ